MTFVVLLLSLGLGEVGAGACPDGPNPCDELPWWVLPAAGGGLAGGLAGVLGLAAVGILRRTGD